MVGEEYTIVGPHVQAPFESREDVHLLDRRVIRWSQVVHGQRDIASCMITGLLCQPGPPSGCAVCALRWPRRCPSPSSLIRATNYLPRVKRRSRRASRSGARPPQHPARSQGAPTSVGEVNSSSVETLRPRATCSRSGRVAPGLLLLIALLAPWRPDDEDIERLPLADGATRLARSNPKSQPTHEPPVDLH